MPRAAAIFFLSEIGVLVFIFLVSQCLSASKHCFPCFPIPAALKFRGCNPTAIELLERTLDLDPDTRITAVEALAHPYLAQYADPTDEPSSGPYDQSFEGKDYDVPIWKSKYADT